MNMLKKDKFIRYDFPNGFVEKLDTHTDLRKQCE